MRRVVKDDQALEKGHHAFYGCTCGSGAVSSVGGMGTNCVTLQSSDPPQVVWTQP